MRILVIDDKVKHQESARETLQDHDVTVLSSFDEAMSALEIVYDEDGIKNALSEEGFPEKPDYDETDRRNQYNALQEKLKAQFRIPFPYDVVLSDLNMPMSRETLAPRVYSPDEEVPYGFIIALKSALAGAKYVLVATDVNHHMSAMSAALDYFHPYRMENGNVNIDINGAKCKFVHATLKGEEKSKSWSYMLQTLIEE